MSSNPCQKNAIIFDSFVPYGEGKKGLWLCETHDDMAVRRFT